MLKNLILWSLAGASLAAQSWLPTSIDPPWSGNGPANVVTMTYNPALTPAQNGQALFNALTTLTAAQDLSVGPGTWLLPSTKLTISLQGSATNPVWIFASNPAQKPVLQRTNTGSVQNILNVGEASPARFMVFQDLDITYQQPAHLNADIVRLYDCEDLWINRCYLHDSGGVGIAANSTNTRRLFITRNEIARPGLPGTPGEGMYLGANFGAVTMSESIVAENFVHDTALAQQGDGIEVKHGSFKNWIVGNRVQRTRFPCLLVGGTGTASTPNFENVVERNILIDSLDNVLQVQGDCIVRNNVAIFSQSSGGAAFQSFNHQGPPRFLRVVHNTFINTGRAANMSSWANAPGMHFGNNACYSQSGNAMQWNGGSTGVSILGNVSFGSVVGASAGFSPSTLGVADFVNATFNGTQIDVTPALGRTLDNHGSMTYFEPSDVLGAPRFVPADPGAREGGYAFLPDVFSVSAATGGTQRLTLTSGSTNANRTYWILGSITGIAPPVAQQTYELPLVSDFWFSASISTPNIGVFQNTLGTLDAGGSTPSGALQPQIVLPSFPGFSFTFWHAALVYDSSNVLRYVSNPAPLFFQ